MDPEKKRLPLIDVSSLIGDCDDTEAKLRCAQEIDSACREFGFFRIKGHGIPAELQQRLDSLSREFFNLPEDEKAKIAMEKGGAAWRGWFPVGGELTSGKPDRKEGLYIGEELGLDHPLVQAGTPLHGENLFPERPSELGSCI